MSGEDELEDRDPNKLNQHIQVTWEDVIGEPYSVRSPECAWRVSQNCFNYSRGCCYVCLSILCAPIYSCCFGISLALLQFQQIWCAAPHLRTCSISCGMLKRFIVLCTQTIITPVTEAVGYLFSKIHVTKKNVIIENEFGETRKTLAV